MSCEDIAGDYLIWRKVYFIVSIQLAVVTLGMIYAYTTEYIRDVVYYNPTFAVTFVILLISSFVILIFVPELTYLPGYKYVSLLAFTVVLMYTGIFIISYFHCIQIIIVVGTVFLQAVVLTLVTFVGEYRIHYVLQYSLLILLNAVFYVTLPFILKLEWLHVFICYIITLISGFYLMLQEQGLMKGVQHHVHTSDDYIVSVFDIYLFLFSYVLIIIVKILLVIGSIFSRKKQETNNV